MQARRPGAPGMARVQYAQGLARGHRLPDHHDRADRLVRGPQPTGVVHTHHAPSDHPAGERHDPATGGAHRLARGAGEVHAPVARQPWAGRWRERPDHGGRQQRPHPARAHRRLGARPRPGTDIRGRPGRTRRTRRPPRPPPGQGQRGGARPRGAGVTGPWPRGCLVHGRCATGRGRSVDNSTRCGQRRQQGRDVVRDSDTRSGVAAAACAGTAVKDRSRPHEKDATILCGPGHPRPDRKRAGEPTARNLVGRRGGGR